jgi:RecA/RadA recombinase
MIGNAAFIDAEHALDPVYARNLGVNVDDILVCQVGDSSAIICLFNAF